MSDPQTIPEPASEATPDFAAFEAAENAKAIGQPPPTAVSDPVSAAPTADAADADDREELVASAAPVAASPDKPISKRQLHINDLIRTRTEAEQRAEQLEARLADAEGRLAKTPTPVASPAAPVVDPTDPEPTEDEIGTKFTTYAAFTKAQAQWILRQDRREAQADAERTATAKRETDAQESQRQRISTWYERRDAFAATEPEFIAKAGPFLDRIQINTPLYDVLTDSPVGPAIVWHLVTHPEVSSRIARLTPIQQVRALGTLEGLFDSTLTSASASAGPAAKTVTTAPAPPTTLAARSADPADPVAAAVARGDFSAFEAEENRRALAGAR